MIFSNGRGRVLCFILGELAHGMLYWEGGRVYFVSGKISAYRFVLAELDCCIFYWDIAFFVLRELTWSILYWWNYLEEFCIERVSVVFCIGRAGAWYFELGELACGILYWESCRILYLGSCRMVFCSGKAGLFVLGEPY